MRKKLAVLIFSAAALLGTAALLAPTPAFAKGCPRNSHLVQCPTYSFCCPNNALCVCL